MGNTLRMNIKDLSMKLVILLPLSNAPRASDLAALDTRFMQVSEEVVTFRIPGLTKTRRSGPPRSFKVPKLNDESVCLVHTLEHYLRQTSNVRSEGNEGKCPLLVSFRKPHKAVCPATIERWIKEVLSRAAANTDIFSAHSTRSAATTAARKQGVSIKDIMLTAGWTRQSTFETFYHKPEVCDFTEAILGGKKGTCIALNNTLSYTQPCHVVELIISHLM